MTSCILNGLPPTGEDGLRQTLSNWRTRSCAALIGATALMSVALSGPANAQAPAATAQHRRHHGRRHRHLEHRRLPPRHDGGPHAEPRQDRRRGHAVHRLLRRGELHGGTRELHHRPIADPHRHDHGRSGRRADRHAGGGADHRHGAEGAMGYATGQFGKNHLGDKNEFLPTVHGFDEFFGYLYHLDAMEDPAIPTIRRICGRRSVRATCSASFATNTDDADRGSALGQGRQAEDRGCGRAVPEAHGNRGRRNPRQSAEVPRQGQGRQQAVLPVAQSDPHAHRDAPVAEISGDAQLEERLVHP